MNTSLVYPTHAEYNNAASHSSINFSDIAENSVSDPKFGPDFEDVRASDRPQNTAEGTSPETAEAALSPETIARALRQATPAMLAQALGQTTPAPTEAVTRPTEAVTRPTEAEEAWAGLRSKPGCFSALPDTVLELLRLGKITFREYAFLGILMKFKHYQGPWVRPTQEELTRCGGCSADTVKRAIERLSAVGLIRTWRVQDIRRHWGQTVYDLTPTLRLMPVQAEKLRRGEFGASSTPTRPPSDVRQPRADGREPLRKFAGSPPQICGVKSQEDSEEDNRTVNKADAKADTEITQESRGEVVVNFKISVVENSLEENYLEEDGAEEDGVEEDCPLPPGGVRLPELTPEQETALRLFAEAHPLPDAPDQTLAPLWEAQEMAEEEAEEESLPVSHASPPVCHASPPVADRREDTPRLAAPAPSVSEAKGLIAALQGCGIFGPRASVLIETYGAARCQAVLDAAARQKSFKTGPAGWIIRALEGHWTLPAREAEKPRAHCRYVHPWKEVSPPQNPLNSLPPDRYAALEAVACAQLKAELLPALYTGLVENSRTHAPVRTRMRQLLADPSACPTQS